jgi:hypothetical protein
MRGVVPPLLKVYTDIHILSIIQNVNVWELRLILLYLTRMQVSFRNQNCGTYCVWTCIIKLRFHQQLRCIVNSPPYQLLLILLLVTHSGIPSWLGLTLSRV